MTDNEIIQTLEYCSDGRDCDNCPYKNTHSCSHQLRLDVVALIRHQKREIKALNIQLQTMRIAANNYKKCYNEAKSKAIKDFAEMLKKLAIVDHLSLDGEEIVCVEDIDNLVKEITEEN